MVLFVFDKEVGHVGHIVGSRIIRDMWRGVKTAGMLRGQRYLHFEGGGMPEGTSDAFWGIAVVFWGSTTRNQHERIGLRTFSGRKTGRPGVYPNGRRQSWRGRVDLLGGGYCPYTWKGTALPLRKMG